MDLTFKKIRFLLDTICVEWDSLSTRLETMKEGELEDDLFTQIDLLSQLDEMQALLSSHLSELERHIEKMHSADKNVLSQEQHDQIASFEKESRQVLTHLKSELKIAEDSYEEIIEKVLSASQDKITTLTTILEQPQNENFLKEEISCELDKEDQLRELRDSLEIYREIRLENNEEEANDPIIDQLDSLIVTCDSALLIEESSS